MAPTIQQLGLDQLSIEDRLALADAIWDSVARETEAAPLSEAQRKELERRLADSIARPDAVIPWEEVKARARARARRGAFRSFCMTRPRPSSTALAVATRNCFNSGRRSLTMITITFPDRDTEK